MKTLIKNGFIIDGKNREVQADVFIEEGVIAEIGAGLDYDTASVIDAKGAVILPGLIDMNCDICDPGYESKEDLISVSKAAVKGGFTSITAKPVTNPVVDNKTVVNYIISKSAKQALVSTYIYSSMTVGCLGEKMAEIGEMADTGIVAISDGGKPVMDASIMFNIMNYAKMFDIPVITMCEDLNLSKGGVVNMGTMATVHGLKGIPKEAEEIMVARNIILAKNSGCRLHISSISTKGSAALVRQAKEAGVNVTCETQPQYFTLTEEAAAEYNTFAKVNPPLRSAEDAEAIIEALKDGTVDVISSGHTPQTLESKNMEFGRASFGISSLETAFALSYEVLAVSGKLTFTELMDKFSKNPADILKIFNKGSLSVGNDADIFIFDKNQEYTISPGSFASKAKFSPYAGKKIKGRIIYTVVNGEVVYAL